jgi:hypothetical protein
MSRISTGKIVAVLVCGAVTILVLFLYPLNWASRRENGDSSATDQSATAGASNSIPLVFPSNERAEQVIPIPAEELKRQLVKVYPVIDEISVSCATDRCEVVGYLDPSRGEASSDGDLLRGGLQYFLASRGYKPVSNIEVISSGKKVVMFRQWVSSR